MATAVQKIMLDLSMDEAEYIAKLLRDQPMNNPSTIADKCWNEITDALFLAGVLIKEESE